MSARWYKRCGADFIHGTMMLSLEEKGAYSLCLDLIYDRGGPIPDDARWLAGVCGVSLRKWGLIRERLISLTKIVVENGLLSNSRADFELLSSSLSSRERAESGAKGGRKRVENEAVPKENKGLAEAELKHPRPLDKIREEKKEGETNVSPRAAGHRLPDDWEPRTLAPDLVSAQILIARGEKWEVRVLESFRNHWRTANGPNARKRDWQAAWANWIIEQDNRDGRRTNGMGRNQPGDGLSPTTRAARSVFGEAGAGEYRDLPQ